MLRSTNLGRNRLDRAKTTLDGAGQGSGECSAVENSWIASAVAFSTVQP
jgi:hypothetical protein